MALVVALAELLISPCSLASKAGRNFVPWAILAQRGSSALGLAKRHSCTHLGKIDQLEVPSSINRWAPPSLAIRPFTAYL